MSYSPSTKSYDQHFSIEDNEVSTSESEGEDNNNADFGTGKGMRFDRINVYNSEVWDEETGRFQKNENLTANVTSPVTAKATMGGINPVIAAYGGRKQTKKYSRGSGYAARGLLKQELNNESVQNQIQRSEQSLAHKTNKSIGGGGGYLNHFKQGRKTTA